jgi:hypothetical protein
VAIIPDDKNWTWVLEQPCLDCGFDAASLDAHDVPVLVRANAAQWTGLLRHPHARLRPTDDQWSALEYACHVRDVFRLFDQRLQLMLTDDGPQFANWDQDETAVADRYDEQDPEVVLADLQAAGAVVADRFATVGDHQWQRTGFRSDGAAFTIESFARYFVHDPMHHLDDVRRGYEILDAGELDT